MKFKASNKRIKNEGVVTAKIVKKIVVESTTAATPGHPTVTKAEQASRIKQMLQKLNDSINACVQAQKEEN